MQRDAAARRTPPLNETLPGSGAPQSDAPTTALVVLPGVGLGERWRASGGAPSSLPDGARYAVEHQLGEGTYGRVFAVLDRDLERSVAVKLLAEPGGDAESLERFVAEARLMARMDHPNVLPVYDVGLAAGGHPFITMKRIQGRTLGSEIDASQAPGAAAALAPGQVVAIIIQVCQAVSYAHHRGIAHLDIKPENIMLGAFGEVLVMDWGSASQVRPESGAHGATAGTPLYMSPEQGRGAPAAPSHDIYAVGATLFHALTRRPPTWSSDPETFWAMKRAGTIQPPTAAEAERVGAPLLAIALKALAADVGERYASIDALRDDLQRYQGGLAISAYRDGLGSYLARFLRAHRQAVGTAAALLALAALAGALAYQHWRLEQSSWKIIAQEDFNHPLAALAQDWRTSINTDWARDGTPLTEIPLGTADSWFPVAGGIGAHNPGNDVDLTYRHPLPPDVRVEWTYLGHQSGLNLNCYFGHDRISGYTVHVGGWGDPRSVILTRGPSYSRLDWATIEPLQAERAYRYRLEREGRHLRFAIDGRVIIDYTSMGGMDAPADPTVGFDCFNSALFVSGVRIYARRAAELVSPLSTPDDYFAVGDVRHAFERYHLLAETHAGTAIGIQAEFGAALCVARTEVASRGEQALADFLAAHPDDAMAPFALWEQLRIAEAAGEPEREQAILGELAAYRGQGILRSVIADRCQRFNALIAPRPTATIADQPWNAGTLGRVRDALEDIDRWSARFGVERMDEGWNSDAEYRLIALGGADQAAARTRDPDIRARARRTLGRFDEMIADPTTPQALHDEALGVSLRGGPREWRSVMAQLYANYHGPGDPAVDREIARSQAAELADAEGNVARTAQGDPFSLRPWALLQTGRSAALLSAYPSRSDLLEALGMRLVQEGDGARGWAILDSLARRVWCVEEPNLYLESIPQVGFGHFIAPALWPLLRRGEPVDLSAALGPRMAFLKGICSQTIWHDARYLLGQEDEAAFLAQPFRYMAPQRLSLLQGILGELRHDPAAALAAYRCVPPPIHEPAYAARFAAWRRQALAARVP
jgi:hypothetical protein